MDQASFDAFYEKSYHRVVAQVYLTCGNLAEAQDCAQEAFVRAWQKRAQLDAGDHPEAWVRTTAHRISISQWRKTRRAVPTEVLPDEGSHDPEVADQLAVRRALGELPVETRRVIVLHHLNDLPVADIATELDIPEGTVKARLSRGRAKLAAVLTRPDPAEALAASMTLMEDQPMHDTDPYGLRKLAEPAHTVPVPAAAEIRRRGQRRNSHRLLGGVAAGLACAVLATGVALGARGDWQVLPWQNTASPTPTGFTSPDPGQSPSVPASLTWEQVPTDDEVSVVEPGDLAQISEEEGWSEQWAPSRCIADRTAINPASTLIRSFSNEPGNDNAITSDAVVMQFGSADEATAARAQIAAWYADCAERLAADGTPSPKLHDSQDITLASDKDFPAGTVADYHLMSWGVEDQAYGDFEESVVVQVGDRLTWYLLRLPAWPERHCTPDTDDGRDEELCSPVQSLPDIAARLAS